MLKGWGSTDRSLLPKAKGSPMAPAPAPWAPLRPLDRMRKRGERSYLCKQQHWLFSLLIQLLNTSPQETRTAAQARGCPVLPGTVPAPPALCNLLLRGGFKQLKMEAGREEPGRTAPRRPASAPAITTGHYTHGAISEQRQDTPAPTCAPSRGSRTPHAGEDALTHPLHARVCWRSHLVQPVPPTVPRDRAGCTLASGCSHVRESQG